MNSMFMLVVGIHNSIIDS